MKDPSVYLAHIIECAERILEYTVDGEAAFMADKRTQDAVLRNLEIMGEAAKRVPEDVRLLYPTVNWRGYAGLRDVRSTNTKELISIKSGGW